jgi:hypothetical protein
MGRDRGICAEGAERKEMEPRWLKLGDAAKYAAIGKHRLIALAKNGKVRGFQDTDSGRGDWIFDRHSLDAYREGQIAEQDTRLIALDILGSFGDDKGHETLL